MRITVNSGNETSHDSKLGVVGTDVNIKVLHVVRRALPPILGMISYIVSIVDCWWLPILRASRPIKVETIDPYTSTIEHLPCMIFIKRLGSIRMMEI